MTDTSLKHLAHLDATGQALEGLSLTLPAIPIQVTITVRVISHSEDSLEVVLDPLHTIIERDLIELESICNRQARASVGNLHAEPIQPTLMNLNTVEVESKTFGQVVAHVADLVITLA